MAKIKLDLEREDGTDFTLTFEWFWRPEDADVGISAGWELERVECSDRQCHDCFCWELFSDDVVDAIEKREGAL